MSRGNLRTWTSAINLQEKYRGLWNIDAYIGDREGGSI